jgi:hypothetical protein
MNETKQLEGYLLNTCKPEEHLLMQASLVVNPELREKAFWQEQTYALIKNYGRKQLKAEIENVHKKMFTEQKFEKFRQKISFIFKRKI